MRTCREWREYYEQNAAFLLDIPWNVGGDCLVVWFFHGKVICKSELRFGQFWHGCWAKFNRAFGHSKAVAAYLSSENRTVVEDTAAQPPNTADRWSRPRQR